MANIYGSLDRALRNVDVTSQIDRLATIDADIREADAAVGHGRSILADLSQRLEEAREKKGSGEREANALRNREKVTELSRAVETIIGEQQATQKGMHAISGEIETLRRSRTAIVDEVQIEIARAFDTSLAAARSEIDALLARLAQLAADVAFIHRSASHLDALAMLTRIDPALATLKQEFISPRDVSPSRDLTDAVAGSAELFRLLRTRAA